MLEKEVLSPIAASAQTIRNLLNDFVFETNASGIEKTLATSDNAKNPKINHGNIFAMLKFAFKSPCRSSKLLFF